MNVTITVMLPNLCAAILCGTTWFALTVRRELQALMALETYNERREMHEWGKRDRG